MASNIEEIQQEGKKDRILIKRAEKELKDSFISRIIPSVNSQLNKHYIFMLRDINACLETDSSLEALDQCTKKAEAVYLRKQEIARASLFTFQSQCQDSLSSCKGDINQQLAKCYQDCLIHFKKMSDEL
jgi:lipopolysaccharide export LptBFGC system permease protein LptF